MRSPPSSARITSPSAPSVSGPVHTITGPSGSSSSRRRSIRIRGCSASRSVFARANHNRPTASPGPAGTRCSSAHAITSEPHRRSSCLSSPAGAPGSSLRSELLHTSSPSSGDWCAGDIAHGFISTRETSIPASASCQAASLPATPPPTTVTRASLTAGSGGVLFGLVGALLPVALEAAQHDALAVLFLDDELGVADRARLRHRPVPRDEVALLLG